MDCNYALYSIIKGIGRRKAPENLENASKQRPMRRRFGQSSGCLKASRFSASADFAESRIG